MLTKQEQDERKQNPNTYRFVTLSIWMETAKKLDMVGVFGQSKADLMDQCVNAMLEKKGIDYKAK